jgi:hypothetical protein
MDLSESNFKCRVQKWGSWSIIGELEECKGSWQRLCYLLEVSILAKLGLVGVAGNSDHWEQVVEVETQCDPSYGIIFSALQTRDENVAFWSQTVGWRVPRERKMNWMESRCSSIPRGLGSERVSSDPGINRLKFKSCRSLEQTRNCWSLKGFKQQILT